MKKGGHISDEQKAAMAAGREQGRMKRAAEKVAMMFSFKAQANVVASVVEQPIAVPTNGHSSEPKPPPLSDQILGGSTLLDIADPFKWQMKIRMFLERSDAIETEAWMEGFRLVYQMAGFVAREQIFRRTRNRCYICDKGFVDGKPAGEAGYYDADREYIKVYCCHQAEFSKLLMKCQEKEAQVAAAADRADKAAKQAAIEARRAAMRLPG